MKILIVSTVMPIRGGVGTHINTISTKLSSLGHQARVINVASSDKNEFRAFSYGLIKILNPILNNDLLFILSFIAARLILKVKVVWELKNKNDYIIHAHDINAFNGLYKLARKRGIKLILTVHGFLHDGGISIRKVDNNSFLGRYLYNEQIKAFKRADDIITISSYQTQLLKNITDYKKLHLIPNFIDFNLFHFGSIEEKKRLRKKFGFKDDEFVLVYAGRLEKSKGLEYILEAIVKIKDEARVKFIVAGNGGERVNLVSFAEKNNIKDHVDFIGEIPHENLVEIYNISDAFLTVSVKNEGPTEGTAIALIEAMACRLPVITTDVGGLNDIVNQIGNDLVVREKDSSSIAEKIMKLYRDNSLRERLGEKSYQAAKVNYCLDTSINNIISVYTGKS